jgi:hypothetical protein
VCSLLRVEGAVTDAGPLPAVGAGGKGGGTGGGRGGYKKLNPEYTRGYNAPSFPRRSAEDTANTVNI